MSIDDNQVLVSGAGGEEPRGVGFIERIASGFGPEDLLLVVASMNLDQRQRLLDLLGLKGEPASRGRPLTEGVIREIRDKVTAEARRKTEEGGGSATGTTG
jgi:hypothetical protein